MEDTAYTGFQGRKLGQDHRHLVDHLGRLEQILCSIPRAGVFPVNWAGALHSVGFIGFAVGLAALGTRLRLGCGPEWRYLCLRLYSWRAHLPLLTFLPSPHGLLPSPTYHTGSVHDPQLVPKASSMDRCGLLRASSSCDGCLLRWSCSHVGFTSPNLAGPRMQLVPDDLFVTLRLVPNRMWKLYASPSVSVMGWHRRI